MKQKNIYSHLTAKERNKLSFPMYWLRKNKLLNGEILDFGCGFGTDVAILKEEGFYISGYDNYYFNDYPKRKFDTITCIYVLNVLEDLEQSDVLMSVSELLKPGGKAFFAVRRDLKKEGFRIHYKHKKPTYQTNVRLPYKSIFVNEYCEIYEYQHYNIVNKKSNDCVFCNPENDIILETALAYSIFDRFPVSEGHALIIPKRHVGNYFDLNFNEQVACQLIVNRLKKTTDAKFKPGGYNIGVNIGQTAGQSINHVHIHLIPRYKGDVDNPLGGVRNVIANKADYITNTSIWEK